MEHRIYRAVKIFRQAKMVDPQHSVFVQTRMGSGCQRCNGGGSSSVLNILPYGGCWQLGGVWLKDREYMGCHILPTRLCCELKTAPNTKSF